MHGVCKFVSYLEYLANASGHMCQSLPILGSNYFFDNKSLYLLYKGVIYSWFGFVGLTVKEILWIQAMTNVECVNCALQYAE